MSIKLVDFLQKHGSIMTNKLLIKKLGINEALLFGELLSRSKYFEQKKRLDKDGYFYNTVKNLEEATTLTGHKQRKAIKKLMSLKLIDCRLKGKPATRHFKFNPDEMVLSDLLNSTSEIQDVKLLHINNTKQIPNNNIYTNTNYTKAVKTIETEKSDISIEETNTLKGVKNAQPIKNSNLGECTLNKCRECHNNNDLSNDVKQEGVDNALLKQVKTVVNSNKNPKVRTPNKIVGVSFQNIPKMLTGFKQWVYWKTVTNKNNKIKMPFTTPSQLAKANDSKTWLFFQDIQNYKMLGFDGTGYVLTEKCPFTVIDLDDCLVPELTEYARQVVQYFNSYTEMSPSGKGLHIVVNGNIGRGLRTKEIEIYSEKRYICMTGSVFLERPIQDAQTKLDKVMKKYRKPLREIPYVNSTKFEIPKDKHPEGERNNKLSRVAGILNKKQITDIEYNEILHKVNYECCIPPLDESEVDSIIRSIKRYR